jgi:hypothetical protein
VSGPVDHPLEREPEGTGEVVSLAGDIVRSKALDFSSSMITQRSLWKARASVRTKPPDEDSTEAVSEPPEQDRAEERA